MTRRYRLTATACLLAVLGFAPAGCLIPVDSDEGQNETPGVTPVGTFPDSMRSATRNGQQPGQLGALRNMVPENPLGIGESKPLNNLFLTGTGQVPVDGVVWTSSNDAIVQINPTTGIARGASKGTAIITVTLQADPSVKAQVTINVSDPNGVSTIKLTPTQGTLAIGDALSMRAEVVLGTGEVKSNVIWTSSDPSIAAVDANGNVKAIAVGTAQILASYADDPVYKGQAYVRVVGTRAEATNASPIPVNPIATAATSDDPGLVAVRKPGTWVEQASGTTEALSFVKFFDAKVGVAGGANVMLATSNAGTTWSPVALGASQGTIQEFEFVAPNDGWIVAEKGIRKFGGSGVTTLVNADAEFGASIVDAYRASKTEGYVLTNVGTVFETDDGGATWDEVATTGGGPRPTRTGAPTAAPSSTPTATPTPEPTATPTAEPAGYSLKLYNMQDSWSYGPITKVNGSLVYYASHNSTCKNFQTNGYYGCSQHFQYTRSGSGWAETQPTQQSGKLVFLSAKEGWRMGGNLPLERTVDGGANWLPVNLDSHINVAMIAAVDTKTIVLGGMYWQPGSGARTNALALTENGGRTWVQLSLEGIDLTAVSMIDPSNLWVVGNGGKIKRYVVL